MDNIAELIQVAEIPQKYEEVLREALSQIDKELEQEE